MTEPPFTSSAKTLGADMNAVSRSTLGQVTTRKSRGEWGPKTITSPPVTSGKMDVLYKVLRTIISAVLLYVRGSVCLQNLPQMMWSERPLIQRTKS